MTCDRIDRIPELAFFVLPPAEALALESHAVECSECRTELASQRSIVSSFVRWPTDVLRPSRSLWSSIAQRIASEGSSAPSSDAPEPWVEPDWVEVAPGISVKELATDPVRHRVSMLVRLAPNTNYPPHTHAGVEELHLLHGELWIDDRKLRPGDFNRAEPGTSDARVWSETGCTCVLTTSTLDRLR